MALQDRVRYLRKEHEEIANLLETLHDFLELAGSNDFNERAHGLDELHAWEHHLSAIREHCRSAERAVEWMYDHYLQYDERARVNREHREIIRLVERVRDELKFAAVDRTITLKLWGKELVSRMHAHIAYEDMILNRIDALSALPDEVVARYLHSAPAGGTPRPN
jgi:hypothetical protein